MCGILLGGSFEPRVRWLVRTKHFPESKNTFQNPKTLPSIQNTFQNPKTLPRIQKHIPESKTLPGIQNTSQNSKHFPESRFWEVFLDSGKGFWIVGSVFGLWGVFCPYERPYQGPVSRKSRKPFGPEKLFRVCNQDQGSNNFENDIFNIS